MAKEKLWYEIDCLLKHEKSWVPFAVTEGEDKALECVHALMHRTFIDSILVKVQEVPQEFTSSHT